MRVFSILFYLLVILQLGQRYSGYILYLKASESVYITPKNSVLISNRIKTLSFIHWFFKFETSPIITLKKVCFGAIEIGCWNVWVISYPESTLAMLNLLCLNHFLDTSSRKLLILKTISTLMNIFMQSYQDDFIFSQGTGSYLFVETSGGSPGLKGSFLSPQLPANQEACLHFWYNMNGADMGDLDVIVQVHS